MTSHLKCFEIVHIPRSDRRLIQVCPFLA